MKIIGKLRIYCGWIGWGWLMYGIGWKAKWFIGLSINKIHKNERE